MVENEQKKPSEVRIHINRKPYESPTPTTGASLYALGKVPAHCELFREVGGDREDEVVPNDNAKLHLKQDEHFYSQKDYRIVVNAQQKVVTTKELSFPELIALAFDSPPSGPNIMFTITYRKGPHANSQGTLVEGTSVKIKEGMVFNVTATDKS